MNDNIDLLKTEVDEIKKSLNELKDNISFSETEKKDQAEILNKQAEVTKQKIQKEIDFLANKTDEESKRKKEEAEALLTSCNDITVLYNSIINPSTSSTTQIPSQSPTESTNIFTKAKDWIKNQRNNILDRGKWRTEGGKNLLRAAGFATTGIGAIGLAYKGIKKLFGRGNDSDEDNNENYESKENTSENDEEKTEVRTNEETNEEENNNNDNYAETTEDNTKEEKKESIWSKLWGKALAWLGIAPAAGTAAAAGAAAATTTDKESDSGTSENPEKDSDKLTDNSSSSSVGSSDSTTNSSELNNKSSEKDNSSESKNNLNAYTNEHISEEKVKKARDYIANGGTFHSPSKGTIKWGRGDYKGVCSTGSFNVLWKMGLPKVSNSTECDLKGKILPKMGLKYIGEVDPDNPEKNGYKPQNGDTAVWPRFNTGRKMTQHQATFINGHWVSDTIQKKMSCYNSKNEPNVKIYRYTGEQTA